MNLATGGKGTRTLSVAAYASLFLAGAVEGLIGSFQYSRNAPLGAIAFCLVLLVTCLLGAWAMRSIGGALWPAFGWVLAMPVASGSVIITNTAAGKWYLYGGTVSVLAGIALSFGAGLRGGGIRGAGLRGAGLRGGGDRPR
jgi:hypothetical protein